MSFLNPIAFWGLLSLLIPLLIHLLSKRQNSTIHFGSNRFLDETETTSARSFQLSDFPLLLIRLLMLSAIIFAITKLVSPDESIRKVNYIEYKLADSGDYKSILSSIPEGEAIQYFSYDNSITIDSIQVFPSAFTLIHHLNQSTDSVTVYSLSQTKTFIGEQVAPEGNIDWQIIPLKEIAVEESIDNSSMNIEIISSQNSARHVKEIKSVINSLREYLPFEINYSAQCEWRIMIDTSALTDAENNIDWKTDHPNFSFERGIEDYQMRGLLSKKKMLEDDFPIKLTQALINSRISDKINDSEIFDPSDLNDSKNKVSLKAELPLRYHSFSKYFWLLAILLIIAERYYSLNHISK